MRSLFTVPAVFLLLALSACGATAPGGTHATGSDAAVSGTTATAPAGAEEPAPVPAAGPGATARTDGGGIVGAPSSREGIWEAHYKVKALYWKADARRPWRDPADFFQKLNRGLLTDEVFADAEARFYLLQPIMILEENEDGEWGGYSGVTEQMVRALIIDEMKEPGYYLVFMAVRENYFGDTEEDKTPPKRPLRTAEEAKAFVNDPEARFVDEKLVPVVLINPDLFKNPLPLEIPIFVH